MRDGPIKLMPMHEIVETRARISFMPNGIDNPIALVTAGFSYSMEGAHLSELRRNHSLRARLRTIRQWRDEFVPERPSFKERIKHAHRMDENTGAGHSVLDPYFVAKIVAEQAKLAINHAIRMGIYDPSQPIRQFDISLENLSDNLGYALPEHMSVHPHGIRMNVVAHELAHLLQFRNEVEVMSKYGKGSENLIEGAADFFAMSMRIKDAHSENDGHRKGMALLRLYAVRYGFDTRAVIDEFEKTGQVSMETIGRFWQIGPAFDLPRKYEIGAKLMITKFVLNDLDIRKTLQDAFRAKEVSDFVNSINKAFSSAKRE